jgi:hypothetical protein
MAAPQPIENQQRSYEVFEKKHDMERTTCGRARSVPPRSAPPAQARALRALWDRAAPRPPQLGLRTPPGRPSSSDGVCGPSDSLLAQLARREADDPPGRMTDAPCWSSSLIVARIASTAFAAWALVHAVSSAIRWAMSALRLLRRSSHGQMIGVQRLPHAPCLVPAPSAPCRGGAHARDDQGGTVKHAQGDAV